MRRRVIGRLRVASRITARMRRWSRSLARLAGVHKSRSMPLGHTATGHRDDVDVVAGLRLRPGQVVHVHLDAAESGKVGVGEVENPHSHRPASDLANREPLTSAYTLVAFHAHPDDAALFTGGTVARGSAEGARVVEATVARESLQRGVRLRNRLGVRPGGVRTQDLAGTYRSRAEITHEIDVRRWVPAKQRALAAHASQASGGADVRTVALLSRLPRPLSGVVLGREWYVEHGGSPSRHPMNDVFASLR